MKELILQKIAQLEEEIEEYEDAYGEDLEELDPMDASGGNFHDAYDLGYEHGETYGQLEVLHELLSNLED
jgi:antirestriction protein